MTIRGAFATVLVALVLLARWGSAEPDTFDATEAIDQYFDAQLKGFEQVISDRLCSAVVEGVVVEVRTIAYEETYPYPVPRRRWHVGRAVTIEVETSWNEDLRGDQEIWTHGGSFELAAYHPESPYPPVCGSSADIRFTVGERAIVTLTRDRLDRGHALWTLQDPKGKLSTDLQCHAMSADARVQDAFDAEAVRYLEERRELFVDDLHALLERFLRYEGGTR